MTSRSPNFRKFIIKLGQDDITHFFFDSIFQFIERKQVRVFSSTEISISICAAYLPFIMLVLPSYPRRNLRVFHSCKILFIVPPLAFPIGAKIVWLRML